MTIYTWRSGAIALAFAGMVAGLAAAWFWEKSAHVPIDPLNGDPNGVVSGEPELEQLAWLAAQLRANERVSVLNVIAARWTATAVVLSTVGTLIGLLAS